MTRTLFNAQLQETLDDIKKLFNKKQEGYGKADDVFYNFNATADRLDIEPLTVLMVLMDKHWVALTNTVENHEVRLERFTDIVVYGLIAIEMIHGEMNYRNAPEMNNMLYPKSTFFDAMDSINKETQYFTYKGTEGAEG